MIKNVILIEVIKIVLKITVWEGNNGATILTLLFTASQVTAGDPKWTRLVIFVERSFPGRVKLLWKCICGHILENDRICAVYVGRDLPRKGTSKSTWKASMG